MSINNYELCLCISYLYLNTIIKNISCVNDTCYSMSFHQMSEWKFLMFYTSFSPILLKSPRFLECPQSELILQSIIKEELYCSVCSPSGHKAPATSKRCAVRGLHKISMRSIFTRPVSNSLATANRDGSCRPDVKKTKHQKPANLCRVNTHLLKLLKYSLLIIINNK